MGSNMKKIPGINTQGGTDLPVLKPLKINHSQMPGSPTSTSFTRWLSELSVWQMFGLAAVIMGLSSLANAATPYTTFDALDALWRWMPFLLSKGFFFNILISLLVMIIGTILGILLGLCQILLGFVYSFGASGGGGRRRAAGGGGWRRAAGGGGRGAGGGRAGGAHPEHGNEGPTRHRA